MIKCKYAKPNCSLALVFGIAIPTKGSWCRNKCYPNQTIAQIKMLKRFSVDLPIPPDDKDLLGWAKEHAKKMPPLTRQLKNAASAAGQAIKAGFKRVDKEEQDRRFAICETCDFLTHRILRRCSECGCCTGLKKRLKAWHCPIDKW